MKKKGFTLVELLVVIAILAILATVSIVGYTQFIAKSKESVCLQEATQIRDMIIAEDINNDYFRVEGDALDFALIPNGNSDEKYTWKDVISRAPVGSETASHLYSEGKLTTTGEKDVVPTDFWKDLGELAKNLKWDSTKGLVYETEEYEAVIKFQSKISPIKK